MFSNKATSRAFKNLAAFVRDITDSSAVYHNNKKQEQVTYLTDEPICIKHITPQGKVTETTKETLESFTKDEWKMWNDRLVRHSIKDRVDEVSKAFEDILKNIKQ